jgi:hypothetical protein
MGNVAAGSVFATFQSAGAGGAGAAVVNGIAQAVAGSSVAATAAAAVGQKLLSSKAKL